MRFGGGDGEGDGFHGGLRHSFGNAAPARRGDAQQARALCRWPEGARRPPESARSAAARLADRGRGLTVVRQNFPATLRALAPADPRRTTQPKLRRATHREAPNWPLDDPSWIRP